MFPPNDNDWIPYVQNAAANNEAPCWVDIVGDVQHPAAYYYLSPTPSPSPTEAAFRMRLNGNPLSSNPNIYALKEFVWGVVIRSDANFEIFTISVNASGGAYNLQVRDEYSALVYNVPIALHDPSQPADNVRVVGAGAYFPCAGPVVPDADFFLDFTLPTDVFDSFNFVSSTYRMCYFTSTQDLVINKEFVCGAIINPPTETPVLCVTKQIMSGPTTVCTDDTHTWFLLITLYNCGGVPVNDVVLNDTLSPDIVPTAPPVFAPNTGVSYDAGIRTVTWSVGTVPVGAVLALTIGLTGYFTAPGHYILDIGAVDGTDLTPTLFSDHGILVYAPDQLTADKELVSGPASAEQCGVSAWTFRITVTNTDVTDIPNLEVVDHIDDSFTIESGPQLTPSAGSAVSNGREIVWTIDNLAGNSAETLLVSVTGFFTGAGHVVFNAGWIENQCGQTVTFQDAGVDVLPITIAGPIRVCGEIVDCRSLQPLSGVSAILYDGSCREIRRDTFDERYCLDLTAGTYSVLFEKEGYGGKFLSLILQSGADIAADVRMAPRTAPAPVRAGDGDDADLDLFSGIVCEKIDAEIVFSSLVCLNSAAEVECLNDILDSYSCDVLCGSKLRLTLGIEKNIVYRLDQSKDFQYDVRTAAVCFPLRYGCRCRHVECSAGITRVVFCKEENIVFNTAYLTFSGYLLRQDDVLVRGVAMEERSPSFS